MVENLKTIDTLDTSPFKKLVMTIGELPTSFVDSMTYYEALAWLVNYLQTEIIPSVNNNAEVLEELQEAFVTLKNYVNNYFENLDVQEEINNKLDQMAEDGTLQEIVSDYLNTRAIFAFDTVSDLKSSTNLTDGSYAKTLGYYSKNDKGGALYKISEAEPSGYYEALTSGLYAELIIENDVNVKQFGCYGDGTHNDTTAMQNAITFAKSENLKLVSPKGMTYLIKSELDMSNMNVDFSNSTIITDVAIDMIVINSTAYYTYLKNINLNMNSIATKGINIVEGRKCYIDDINITECTTYGIYLASGGSYEIYANNINITGNATGTSSVGIYLARGDSYWNNIVIIDCHTGIYQTSNTLNFFTNVHAWLLSKPLVSGSAMFKFDTSIRAFIDDCYSDTYFYSFYSESGSPTLEINNFQCIYANYVMTAEVMSAINDNPYLFYFSSEDADGKVAINNIDYSGLIIGTTAYTGHLSNKSYFNGKIVNGTFQRIDKNMPYSAVSSANRSADITVSSETLQKLSNVATLQGVYVASNVGDDNRHFWIGTLPYYWRPKNDYNYVAQYGASQYGQSENCYVYISTNGKIEVTLPNTATGTQVIKFNMSYITDNKI